MALLPPSELRDVYGIGDEEKALMKAFLQGAVYCWCKNRKDEWFSLRDLMGGDNYYWQGTPLLPLYEKHNPAKNGWEYAVEQAGKDSGWLLKSVIADDKRSFETKTEEQIRKYCWVGGER